MAVVYGDRADGDMRFYVAAVRCDGCAAELATGRCSRVGEATDRQRDASRAEALSKAVYRAGLVPGVCVESDGAAQCTACARGAKEKTPAPLRWTRGLGEGDAVGIVAHPDGGEWVVAMVVSVRGIRYERSERVADTATANALAAAWLGRSLECASAVRDAARLYPRDAEKARERADAAP